jgi:hypothetical protein
MEQLVWAHLFADERLASDVVFTNQSTLALSPPSAYALSKKSQN